MERIYDHTVVGAGIAGYSAALYLNSRKANYLWLGQKGFGGKLRSAEWVRNFPAFKGTGKEFAEALERQRTEEGVRLTEARVDGIYKTDVGFLLTAGRLQCTTRSVILATGVATGATVRGEERFLGKGVSYCAVCDGALYKNKRIAVVITSEDLAEEVEYLATFAEEVFVFSQRRLPYFHAPNVRLIPEYPREIVGKDRVEAIVTARGELPVRGVFFLRNAAPPASFAGGLITEGAHVKVRECLKTNLKGLFAAGDVTGRPYQFAKASGEGLSAAYAALEYVKSLRKEKPYERERGGTLYY